MLHTNFYLRWTVFEKAYRVKFKLLKKLRSTFDRYRTKLNSLTNFQCRNTIRGETRQFWARGLFNDLRCPFSVLEKPGKLWQEILFFRTCAHSNQVTNEGLALSLLSQFVTSFTLTLVNDDHIMGTHLSACPHVYLTNSNEIWNLDIL